MNIDTPSVDPSHTFPSAPAPPLFMRTALEKPLHHFRILPDPCIPSKIEFLPLPRSNPTPSHPSTQNSRYSDILHKPPQTAAEAQLMLALQESEARNTVQKNAMMQMQATTILAGMYNNRAQDAAAGIRGAEEEKRAGRGRWGMETRSTSRGMISSSLLRRTTGDGRRRRVEKEKRQEQREARAVELAEWQKANEAMLREEQDEKGGTRGRCRSVGGRKSRGEGGKKAAGVGVKPKLADYGVESLLPRPKKVVEEEDDEENGRRGLRGTEATMVKIR
ncbi:hypothetical protein R3P38DRAFT_3379803 [Favolaschia claudopus]|uniref:Uncharacterized protein n=1 Tax=Favolaschia claudopus TaxID=2862362 RepID=A0AAV9Z4I0_9AGAR